MVDIDVDTGETKVRRFYALDDCGTRINPMIIEGQIHGGLTEAFGIAMGQEIHYDEDGNVTTASLMDYFLPTAVETPHWETDCTATPSPHHPIGAKGVGESPNVGGVPVLLQRGERRVRVPRLDPHPDAARPLAHLDGGGKARPAWVDARAVPAPGAASAVGTPVSDPRPSSRDGTDAPRLAISGYESRTARLGGAA